MTSTAVDVSLCLLLVSAAAVTLVGADAGAATGPVAAGADSRVGATVQLLAASTATVKYQPDSGGSRQTASGDGLTGSNRTAHGTLAELLAAAAARSAFTANGNRVDERAGFRRAVRGAVAEAVGARTQILIREPVPGGAAATPTPGIVVGADPPPIGAVHAARFTVPTAGRAGGERGGAETTAVSDRRVVIVVRTWSA
ncbi:DUF7284 family protein [Halobaculum sp. D14]|uniref:DUF7284 family protein n=1 Tax=Halobaculum sp. D14 TaxID=3421642 RepID=UPI003EBC055C